MADKMVRIDVAIAAKAAGQRGMPADVRTPAAIARWCVAYVAGLADPHSVALPKNGPKGEPIDELAA